MTLQLSLEVSLVALLLVACCYDLAQRRIPNRLLACALVCTLVLHLVLGPAMALLATVLAGFLTGLLMFLPLYVVRAMAAGDVKLMATVGTFCGPLLTFQIGLATYCCGGLLALAIVLWRGKARTAALNVGALLRPLLWRMTGVPLATEPMPAPSVGNMPYALAIALGAFLVLGLHHL
ncbi:MAG: prepilin peptidase [Pseudomonadota bacterium]